MHAAATAGVAVRPCCQQLGAYSGASGHGAQPPTHHHCYHATQERPPHTLKPITISHTAISHLRVEVAHSSKDISEVQPHFVRGQRLRHDVFSGQQRPSLQVLLSSTVSSITVQQIGASSFTWMRYTCFAVGSSMTSYRLTTLGWRSLFMMAISRLISSVRFRLHLRADLRKISRSYIPTPKNNMHRHWLQRKRMEVQWHVLGDGLHGIQLVVLVISAQIDLPK